MTATKKNNQLNNKYVNQATDDILTALRSNYFTAMIGDAQSKQTKLILQNVIDTINTTEVSGQDGTLWRCVTFYPGISPIENLAAVLAAPNVLLPDGEVVIGFRKMIEGWLRESSYGLIKLYQYIKNEFNKPFNLLILVSHFDDQFKLLPDDAKLNEDRLLFNNLLLRASVWEDTPVYVGISISPKYISQSFKYQGLGPAIQEGGYFFKKMTNADFLKLAEQNFTDTNLLPVIKKDIQAQNNIEILDLEWHFLMKDKPQTLEEYIDLGGLSGIIAKKAEMVYDNLTPEEVSICEVLFQACSDNGQDSVYARSEVLLNVLKMWNPDAPNDALKKYVAVIEKFRAIGLLEMIEPTTLIKLPLPIPEKTILIPSHQLLLNSWPRAVNWAKEEAMMGFNYEKIVRQAIDYEEKKAGGDQGENKKNETEQPKEKNKVEESMYKLIMNKLMRPKTTIVQEDLMSQTDLDNGAAIFTTRGHNEFWAEQYYSTPLPETSWAKPYETPYALAKEFWSFNQTALVRKQQNEKAQQVRLNNLYKRSAIFMGLLFALSIIFMIWGYSAYSKIKLTNNNLRQQKFITALSDAHIIDISPQHKNEILRDKSIRSLEDVMQYFNEKDIIDTLTEDVKNALYGVHNLYQAFDLEAEDIEAAIKSEAKELLSKTKGTDNELLYYSLNVFHKELVHLAQIKGRKRAILKTAGQVLVTNPVKRNQFAYIDKFGKLFLMQRNTSLIKKDNNEVIATVQLPNPAYALAFSPNGKSVFVGTIMGEIFRWNIFEMDINTSPKEPFTNLGEKIYHLHILNNENGFIAATKYQIHSHKGKFDTRRSEKHQLGEIRTLKVTPNQDKILVGGAGRSLIIDLTDTYILDSRPKIIQHPNAIITAIAINKAGIVHLAKQNGGFHLFDINDLPAFNTSLYFSDISADALHTFKEEIVDLAIFDTDEATLVAGARVDGTVFLWSTKQKVMMSDPYALHGHKNIVHNVIFNNEKELISMSNHRLLFWYSSTPNLKEALNKLLQ